MAWGWLFRCVFVGCRLHTAELPPAAPMPILTPRSLRASCPCRSPASDNLDVGQKGWKLLASGFQFAVWEATF